MSKEETQRKLLQLDEGVRQYLLCALQHLDDQHEMPLTKPSFTSVIGYFAAFYIILSLVAITKNLIFLAKIYKRKLYHNYLFAHLGFLSFINLLAAATAIPLSFVTQVTYWTYGSFICRNLPLIQELFANVAFLTPAVLAAERYREIVQGENQPIPVWLASGVILLFGGGCALPGSFFITYFSTKDTFGMHPPDVQICLVRTGKMEEYARAMLILLYLAPVLVVAVCHAKISIALKTRESEGMGSLEYLKYEQVTQNHISLIVLATAICWLPMNVSSVIQFIVTEECDFTKLDCIYCGLIWIAFAHTICTPLIGMRMIDRHQNYQTIHYQNLFDGCSSARQDSPMAETCLGYNTFDK